jgi:RNA-directed DNA polymerase
MVLEPSLEPVSDRDSLDIAPGRSALDAVELVRRRSWRDDLRPRVGHQGLRDTIDHEPPLRAVGKHCTVPWILLYSERRLKTPMDLADGQRVLRERGTPQGAL